MSDIDISNSTIDISNGLIYTSGDMSQQIPPYVSFRTFHNFLEELRAQGLPSRVDRSVMAHKSGTIQSQLLLALGYLGLISENERLKALLSEKGARRQEIRREMLEDAYEFFFDSGLSLERATSKEVEEVFRSTGASGETVRRAISFFLRQAKQAGFKVSPYIKPHRNKSQKPRSQSPPAEDRAKTPGNGGSLETGAANVWKAQLEGAGQVEVRLDVDLFSIDPEDREFVLNLIDLVRSYHEERKNSSS